MSIGAIDYFVTDVINIAYAEVGYVWSLGPDLSLALGAQLTDQRSVGDDRLTGTGFDTWVEGRRPRCSMPAPR